MKELYLRFMAPIVPGTTDQFFQAVDRMLTEKYERLHLLLSSPGGSVPHGLSIYNFLRGASFETYTYNFGSVDSISVAVYCAGKRRFSVPYARFVIHGVHLTFNETITVDESHLEEHLRNLRIDQKNIASVIAGAVNKSSDDILQDIHRRITLDPSEAQEYGLTHEIKTDLIPSNAELVVIRETPDPNALNRTRAVSTW